jgi:Carboxypeptidase regulatory-like domain/TonB dependent receptor
MRQDPRTFTHIHLRALAAAALLALALPATAQLSTATVRGAVTADARAQAGATMTANNTASGQVVRTTSRTDGSYTLVGLQPGTYKIDVAAPGFGGQSQTLTVLVGQTVDLDATLTAAGTAATTELNRVTVIGSQGADRKTSEVGTNITQKQIDALPQNSRNFLAFADVAPGVRFDVDPASGQGTLRGGAQNQDNINIFIDGVGQKNYILRGGASGGDSTRGNPFQQSAIAEYKVLSSNYKAEFDQVSSTAITAVTKSGTNEFHGEVFGERTGSNWTGYSPFEEKIRDEQGIGRLPYERYEYGFSLGGPIKQDVAHFFLAYEGKDIGDTRTVIAKSIDTLAAARDRGIVPGLLAQQGSFSSKFKEHLLFGKVDLDIDEKNRLELTTRIRRESDKGFPEDRTLSVASQTKDRTNDETRVNLKYQWTGATLLNEANLGYEDYRWNPRSLANEPLIRYKASSTNVLTGASDVLLVGGSPDAQDRRQKAFLVQDDLTWTGANGHVVKGGVKLKDVKFDLSGTSRSFDVVQTVIDNQSGLPYYDAASGNCTTVGGAASTAPPRSVNGASNGPCLIDRAIGPAGVAYKNKQFGIYVQDDWAVTKQLELNLGVRWDYETNMLNDDYITPADRVAAVNQLDTRAGAPAGQTYAQSIAKGGVNINDYISTGSNRKAFTGAFQPRIGFSYDLTGDKQTVAFGGFGRAYDRTIANNALDEVQKNQQAGGEIWLIKNDHKMPFTDQFSVGLRQGLGIWNGEVGVSYQRGHNQFNWFVGNRDPQGGYGTQSPIDPLFGGPPGYGTLILGDFVTQTKTAILYLKAEKPYTQSSGWAAAVTYTYSDGKTTHREWNDEIFNFTYGKPGQDGYNPSELVERHRLVATGLTDGLLPWGLLLSGKVTLGSGLPYRIIDCTRGSSNCVAVKGEAITFRQFDIGFAKDVSTGFGRFTVRADVINLLNTANYGGYGENTGGAGNRNYLGGDDVGLGVPSNISGPMRTLKLSLRYTF